MVFTASLYSCLSEYNVNARGCVVIKGAVASVLLSLASVFSYAQSTEMADDSSEADLAVTFG